MLGYDAPKSMDVTGYIRAEAVRLGLDPDEVMRVAGELLRGWDL